MIPEEEIKKIARTCLQNFIRGKEWIDKDYLDRYLSSISDLRKFFNDIAILSVAIIGVVVPILIQSEINLDKSVLLISMVFFSMEVILWIVWRFYIIKEEIKKWPIEKGKVDKKYEDTINDLKKLEDNPNAEKFKEIVSRIDSRYAVNVVDNKKDKSFLQKKYIIFLLKIDYWLLGLFILALILFLSSFRFLFAEILLGGIK